MTFGSKFALSFIFVTLIESSRLNSLVPRGLHGLPDGPFVSDLKRYEDVKMNVKETGEAKIKMKFWRILPKNPLSEPSLSVPLDYVIGEMLYVTAELDQDAEMYVENPFLHIDNCYASSTGSHAKVHIITNGCASPDPSFKHAVITNGESRFGCFMFQMFELRSSSGMFVHCDATLCETYCKPKCYRRRVKRYTNETLGENKVRIGIGNVQFTNGTVTPKKPSVKVEETKAEPASTDRLKTEEGITTRFIMPIALIFANISVLAILGLVSYALGRSISIKRRTNRNKQHQEGLFDDAVGYVSFSPPVNTVTSSGSSGNTQPKKFAFSHSFCQDKDCVFTKDIKGKNRNLFSKKNKKARQQLKDSMFKNVVYDTSTLTCPTPFNSPPPSPPIVTPVVISTGSSPIRCFDENRNLNDKNTETDRDN